MRLKINDASELPLYQQIHDQIILGLAMSTLQANEPLPSVRQLADELEINMLTVAKSYQLLKAEGYLVSDRRRGTRVAANFKADSEFSEKLQKQLKLLLAAAKIRGLEESAVQKMVTTIYADFVKGDSKHG